MNHSTSIAMITTQYGRSGPSGHETRSKSSVRARIQNVPKMTTRTAKSLYASHRA